MKSFTQQLTALNASQRQAVETIEGPVLVVAGPGTGKTQLLSMRAANIVHSTDSAPNNILCLTFTDSAASAMRQRLISLMGAEGNKVAVHTFHSFGTEIINHNPEHFYNGARFAPASDMAGYEILRDVFEHLPHSSPLARKMNDEFTSLKDARSAISNLKRAGLLPSELLDALSHNEQFCDFAEPKLREAFAARLSKKDIPKIAKVADDLAANKQQPMPIETLHPLGEVCSRELSDALTEAEAAGKTTALTAWRNRWLEKNKAGKLVMKDRKFIKRLRALAEVYDKYRTKLSEAELFDFDDMVSLVAHTLENTPELRFNLQEQYLYIMVDEFQDTNGAQLRLLHALADSPVSEGRPNVLAVGDDDQAIYAFQGAELSNILDFTNRYRDVAVITLTENYRSTGLVLDHARRVITKGTERLETTLKGVNKTLKPHKTGETSVELHQFETPAGEYQWVTEQIQAQLNSGVPASEIAVLSRHHKQLIELLPHMHAAGLATNYEKRSNVLENAQVRELITLAEVVAYLADRRFDLVEELLPELLSFEFWGLTTTDLWQLSLRSFKERRMWLELMVEGEGKLKQIAEFLIISSHQALREPLESMLDVLIGANEEQVPNDDTENGDMKPHGPNEEAYVSPFRAFYFNEKRLQETPTAYMDLLGSLRSLRQAALNYRPGETLTLGNLLDLISLHERTNTPIVDGGQVKESLSGVTLMTAHKAKGLEFTTVFVLSCQDEIWGRRAKKHGSSLHFPHNLPIEPAGESYNDALRLFFVALTRAKQYLYLTTHETNTAGKSSLLAEFLQDEESLQVTTHDIQVTDGPQTHSLGWEQRWLSISPADQRVLLSPILENYKLSATHLNNFIDITRGGPQAFLLQNLLRFPQAMSAQQVFGHIVHAVLQRAHTHLSATGERRPLEDVFYDYELQLQRSHLGDHETAYLLEKGSDVLHTYLAERYESFKPSQKAERNFYGQNVVIGKARLTGAIDLMELDKTSKTAVVIDYKTGKSFDSWRAATDAEKIKLHKYKQQLMFYKLLVENARDFSGYRVEKGILDFVEADEEGKLNLLETDFNADELAAFTQLIAAVWQRIQNLDFPDTSRYPLTYKGVLEFEADLL